MTDSTSGSGRRFAFELDNVGAGSETLTAASLAADHDYVLVVLLRTHYCPLCRDLVSRLADRYDEFAMRGSAVVPVLPDSRERALVWHRRYELPFPMLADPVDDVRTDCRRDDPPDEYDTFAPFQRTIPSLPGVALFECDDDSLRLVSRHGGPNPRDVPTVDSLLDRIDARRDGDAVDPTDGVRADG